MVRCKNVGRHRRLMKENFFSRTQILFCRWASEGGFCGSSPTFPHQTQYIFFVFFLICDFFFTQYAVQDPAKMCNCPNRKFVVCAWSLVKFSSHNRYCWNWRLRLKFAVSVWSSSHPTRNDDDRKKRQYAITICKNSSNTHRWHSWPILRLVATVRVRWISARIKLSVLGRLRGPWKAIVRNNLSAVGV